MLLPHASLFNEANYFPFFMPDVNCTGNKFQFHL